MKELQSLISRYKNNINYYVGYPQNLHFDYSDLFEALSYPINNFGDPFLLSNPISSHEYEQEVINWFLKLFGLDKDLGWGYVTTGGTEGILFGIWQAKENLKNPILYFSSYAHYAVIKSAKITGLDYKIINSTSTGEMDYNDFLKKVEHGRDAIIVATLGNTMTSAIDNVATIREILLKKNINAYVHADAAFDGMILPFIKTDYSYRLTEDIDSISISGHKIIGSPVPCGVVLIHKRYLEATRSPVNYINNVDCTVSGSRSGFAALILWDAIRKNKWAGFKEFVYDCISKAEEFTQTLNEHNIHAWRFNHAMTIVLDKLPAPLTQKWRAPSNDRYTTLTALPKLTSNMLNELISDITYFKKFNRLQNNRPGLLFPITTPDISLTEDF